MVNILNTSEGGVVGAAVTTANSGGGSGTAFDYLDVPSGSTSTLVYTQEFAAHGTKAMYNWGNGGRAAFGWAAGSLVPGKLQAFRAYIKAGSIRPTAESQIITAWNSSSYIVGVNYATDGRLKVTNRIGTVLYTTTTVIPTTGFTRVEISVEVGVGTADGVIRFAIYNGDSSTPLETMFTTTTADLGTTNVVSWRAGKQGITGTFELWWDDLEVNPLSSTLIGPLNVSSPSLRPTSVTANPGVWSNVGGSSSIAAALADESDTTYGQTAPSPTNASITFALGGRLATGTPSVLVRLSATSASPATYATVQLLQGSTIIATRTHGPLTTTVSDYNFTLTTGEAAAITDRGNLSLTVIANQP